MRAQGAYFVKHILLVAALLAAGTACATAQSESPRQACSADAQKLCSSAIPNRQKVLACLEQNREQLSQACKAALEAAGK